eukprot:3306040-Amphidinium_carterae.1
MKANRKPTGKKGNVQSNIDKGKNIKSLTKLTNFNQKTSGKMEQPGTSCELHARFTAQSRTLNSRPSWARCVNGWSQLKDASFSTV